MADYDVATSNVPLGGRAVANFLTFDEGASSDVTSITVDWRDQNGLLLETLTRTTIDVSGTDIYGNASTLTDPAGTGNYKATLVIDQTNYVPPSTGLRWSVTVTIVKGTSTDIEVFYFDIVPTTLSVSLDVTTVANAVKRQSGITIDVEHVARDTNSVISLRSGIVYAINAAYKNGSAITNPTNYTWSLFRSNVTVTTAPAVNDHYVFTVQKKSDEFVNDIVNRAINEVLRGLKPHYAQEALTNSPSVADIVKAIAIGQLKQDSSEGVALDSAHYRSGFDLQREARKQIIRIQRGEEDIFDSTGAVLGRRDGSLVGGYRNPNGPIVNRLDLQDRLQQYTGLFVTLYPDPIIAQSRLSRGFTA